MAAILFLCTLNQPVLAIETPLDNGGVFEWDVGLSDLRLTNQGTRPDGYKVFYYESSQLSPYGNTLQFRAKLKKEYAHTGTIHVHGVTAEYDFPLGNEITYATQPFNFWPYLQCHDGQEVFVPVPEETYQDVILDKPISVSVVPETQTPGFAAFGFWVISSSNYCDERTKSEIYIIVSLASSAQSSFMSSLSKGGQDENQYTEFDSNEQCDSIGFPHYSVNTATMNPVVQDTDFYVQSLGPPLATTRVWNPDPEQSGMFGNGWRFLYESTIQTTCNQALLFSGSGAITYYNTKDDLCGSSLPEPYEMPLPASVHDRLTYMRSGDYWLLKQKSTRYTYRYDAVTTGSYRLTSVTDLNGNRLQITYNQTGRITAVTDAASRVLSFAYNGQGLVSRITVPGGGVLPFVYDSENNLIQSTDLYGTIVQYGYDAGRYMTYLSYAGKTTLFSYSENGGWKHLAALTDAEGSVKQYDVATDGSGATSITDARGAVVRYSSSSARTTGRSTDFAGSETTTYNSAGLPSSHTNPNGNQTNFEYDSKHNLTRRLDYYKQSSYSYDAHDNLLTMTNPLGQILTFNYDSIGNLTALSLPSGKQRRFEYNSLGKITAYIDADNRTTSFTYDSFGNLKTETDPLGRTTTHEYDAHGINRTATTDPAGRRTFTYDANRRLTSIIYPDSSTRSFRHDGCSMTGSTDENGNPVTINRDRMLRISSIQDPFGAVTSYTYDANGNMVTKLDPLMQVTSLGYDAANRLNKKTDPMGNTARFSYYNSGYLWGLQDEQGYSSNYIYDIDNNPVELEYPVGYSRKFTRDLLGRITKMTNARSSSVDFIYNADGFMTEKRYGSTTVATYSYNSEGHMLTHSDASSATTAYTRNVRNDVTGITYPDGKTVSFAYDTAGNISSIAYPGGVSLTYTYSNRNYVNQMQWGGGSIGFTYDPVGNLLSASRSNGVSSNFRYDQNNRYLSIEHTKEANLVATLYYARNAIGNVIAETINLPVAPPMPTLNQSGVYSRANRPTSFADSYIAHDDDGNLTGMTGSRTFSAVYDDENRMVRMTSGGVVTDFSYDALGNRVRVTRGTETTKYYYDHLKRLLFETNANGTVSRLYFYRGNTLEAVRTSSGSTYFYHYDKTGNTVAITDSNGATVRAYAYTPYGEQVGTSGTFTNRHTFVGAFGVIDEGNGIYFMQNRYYDATLGRFIQVDPLAYNSGATNLYQYAGGNPVTRIDPAGLDWKDYLPGADAIVYGGGAGVTTALLTSNPVGWGALAGIGLYTAGTAAWNAYFGAQESNQKFMLDAVKNQHYRNKKQCIDDIVKNGGGIYSNYYNNALKLGESWGDAASKNKEAIDSVTGLWDSFTGMFSGN